MYFIPHDEWLSVGHVRPSINTCVLLMKPFVSSGETDWKVIAIDVTDPLAPKMNGRLSTHIAAMFIIVHYACFIYCAISQWFQSEHFHCLLRMSTCPPRLMLKETGIGNKMLFVVRVTCLSGWWDNFSSLSSCSMVCVKSMVSHFKLKLENWLRGQLTPAKCPLPTTNHCVARHFDMVVCYLCCAFDSLAFIHFWYFGYH